LLLSIPSPAALTVLPVPGVLPKTCPVSLASLLRLLPVHALGVASSLRSTRMVVVIDLGDPDPEVDVAPPKVVTVSLRSREKPFP